MKNTFSLILGAAFCSSACGAPFVNLGFDLANTNHLIFDPSPYGLATGGTQADMLPGWSLTKGEHELNWLVGLSIGLNVKALGLGYATLVDHQLPRLPVPPGLPRDTPGLRLPFEGRFALVLVAFDFPPVYIPYMLQQTGDVPPESQTIRFFNFGNPYKLEVNGTEIGLTYEYFENPEFPGLRTANVFGDISAFAGQTVELRFTTVDDVPWVEKGPWYGLDSIRFSPEPIPEPSTWALLAFGGAGLWLAARGKGALRRRPPKDGQAGTGSAEQR